jgi:uncharacterized YigZ family protein
VTYRTLEGRGEAAFEVRGSEFIGHAEPARSVDAAESFVETVRETYPDATHNVPVYRVRVGDGPGGDGLLREYQNDDGEPSGSAGKPMLNVLQGEDLENVAVVVTRYYGGTNLGVGGLVRAYSGAAKESIEDAGIVEEEPQREFSLTVSYGDSGTVRGVLESAGCEFEADYGERVAFDVRVPESERDALVERLRSATNGRADPE